MSREGPRSIRDARANDFVETEYDRISRLSARDLQRELLKQGVDLERYGEEALALRLRIRQEPSAIAAREARRSSVWGGVAALASTMFAAIVALARRAVRIGAAKDDGRGRSTRRSPRTDAGDVVRAEVPRAGADAGATERNV